MIIARSAGRLGNQLFVYAALGKLNTQRETLVLVGFDDLVQNFPEVLADSRHVPLPQKHWWRWDLSEKILKSLGFLRLVSIITLNSAGRRLVTSRGIFSLTLFNGGWCQDENLIDPDIIHTLIQAGDSHALQGETGEEGALTVPGDDPVFFIHIRRGDYLAWPTPELPAALPESWYQEAMDKIRKTQPGVRFLVFSDDDDFAEQFARGSSDAEAITASPRETLTLMSRCTGGILSASSFSWWGAQLASRHSQGPFIAPLHWISWSEQRWDDSHSLGDTTALTWIPVVSPNQES
jgi:hypothetical protein